MSATLIILPLIDVVVGGITPSGVLQTALAIILLVYSTLLSSENFYYKSKEFYRCSLELEKLIGKIDAQEISVYKEADNYYRIILDGFENHETIDYERAWYNKNKWNMGFFRKNFAGLLTRVKVLAGYVYYAPFIILFYFLYKYIQ